MNPITNKNKESSQYLNMIIPELSSEFVDSLMDKKAPVFPSTNENTPYSLRVIGTNSPTQLRAVTTPSPSSDLFCSIFRPNKGKKS